MNARTIEITINPNGEIQVEAQGFKGRGCEAATKAIEAELGVVRGRKKKTEYHVAVGAGHTQRT